MKNNRKVTWIVTAEAPENTKSLDCIVEVIAKVKVMGTPYPKIERINLRPTVILEDKERA